MKEIKANQESKEFPEFVKPRIKKYKEPDEIVKEMEVVKCNTNIPKMAYNIKINTNKFDMDKRKLSIYMFIIFNLLFGDTSDFDEEMKSSGIITNTLYYNLLNIDSHFIITLNNSLDKYEELIKEIDKKLKNVCFSEAELERKKKVLISNEVFSYENIEMVNDMIVDNIIFDGRIETDIIDIINSLNIDELNNVVSKIDFENKSIVILKK
jgi:predicted Zn-dependent peptidase